jgi:glycosyltransferase involved in cell wall biosynthesis
MNDNQRLALLVSSLSGGGAERVMLLLANGLVERGYAVDLVLARAVGPYRSEVDDRIRVVDLGARRNILSLWPLVRYLRRERPAAMLSALHDMNCIAVWARALSRVECRLVLSTHNTLSQSVRYASQRRSKLMPLLARYTYPHADAVVAVSAGVADDLASTIGLARDAISVIFNPVVTAGLIEKSQEMVEHPWFATGQPPVILAAGRFVPQKDFPTLLKAFQSLRQKRLARLVILGEGEGRAELERIAKELGIQQDVDLPGFVANPYAYMRNAKVFVLSSAWEGFGNVLVEAMACGAPVVSTDCPSGPAEILENGRWGRLVPVREPSALAMAISDVLADANRQRGVAGRAAEFSVERAIERYLRLLVPAVGSAKGHPRDSGSKIHV